MHLFEANGKWRRRLLGVEAYMESHRCRLAIEEQVVATNAKHVDLGLVRETLQDAPLLINVHDREATLGVFGDAKRRGAEYGVVPVPEPFGQLRSPNEVPAAVVAGAEEGVADQQVVAAGAGRVDMTVEREKLEPH
jgi:hypothetical protein